MMDLVQRSLDAAALSHTVLANNVANVDTPGFKRSDVVFSEKLQQAIEAKQAGEQGLVLSRTDPRHLGPTEAPDLDTIKPEVVTDTTSSLRNDGNNVDIDHEVSLLAQNTVWYQTLAQITAKQFSELQSAITEGKK
jgi:flagellar basal-body rod protein FlgB